MDGLDWVAQAQTRVKSLYCVLVSTDITVPLKTINFIPVHFPKPFQSYILRILLLQIINIESFKPVASPTDAFPAMLYFKGYDLKCFYSLINTRASTQTNLCITLPYNLDLYVHACSCHPVMNMIQGSLRASAGPRFGPQSPKNRSRPTKLPLQQPRF
jgi:hypothetical protein